jgi:hypothetical protein
MTVPRRAQSPRLRPVPLPRPLSSGSSLHGKKSPVQEFLPDSRVEKIWDRLQKELKLPENTNFATDVTPERWVDKDGISILQKEQVRFWAVCPNPQPRWEGKLIKHYVTMDLLDWRRAELEKWRFAGMPDPAYVIFRALCRKLIQDEKQWRELN